MVALSAALSVLELAFGLGAALVAVSAWQHRAKPAGYPVFVLASAGCGYAAINGLGTLVASPTATMAFGHLRGPFSALIAVAVFYTAVEYTDRQGFNRPAVHALAVGFVAVDAIAYVTNPLHELVMTAPSGASGAFVATNTSVVWIHYAISFAFVLTGLMLLAIEFGTPGFHRSQTAAMLVGIGVAFGFFFVEAFVSVHPTFDSATLGIFLGSMALLWAITRADFLETVPVAREALMDTMDEAIVALDRDDRVIDANRATLSFLDAEESILGRPVADVFGDYPGLVAHLERPGDADHEFSVEREGERRHYHVATSPITHRTGLLVRADEPQQVGRLAVITDVTERRRNEAELDLLKQVFARVLRHNIRNDLNVISGNARLVEDRLPADETEPLETIQAYTDKLLQMSEKARDLETVIESPRSRTCLDLSQAVDYAVADVLEDYPDAHVESRIHRPCWVSVHKDVETAIRNVLENACEYDDSPHPHVEITTDVAGDSVELSVADDGPGISEHELAVLESETETTLHHGSGLGLWIVNWIVDRSNGDISIDAGPEGTTVTLSLPLAKEVEAADPSVEPTEAPASQ